MITGSEIIPGTPTTLLDTVTMATVKQVHANHVTPEKDYTHNNTDMTRLTCNIAMYIELLIEECSYACLVKDANNETFIIWDGWDDAPVGREHLVN